MNNEKMILVAAAGVAIYTVLQATKPRKVATGYTVPRQPGTAQVLNGGGMLPAVEVTNTALPGDVGWGWKYYTDGTAIDPQGNYYKNGQLVYSA